MQSRRALPGERGAHELLNDLTGKAQFDLQTKLPQIAAIKCEVRCDPARCGAARPPAGHMMWSQHSHPANEASGPAQ